MKPGNLGWESFPIGAVRSTAMDLAGEHLAAVLGVSGVLVSCAAWFVLRRLGSGRIRKLAKAVADVSATQDVSARVTMRASGALGLLVASVNKLLARTAERIAEREQDFRKQEQHFEQWKGGESARLELEVVARTRKLRESNEQLQAAAAEATARNQAQTRFIANLTHEIRTPMNGVLGMTELLFNTELTAEQLRYTRAVLGSGEDLLSIINNILDFSKIENGKLERVDNQPFSPRDCVERVSELLAARASQEGLSLSHDCADDLPEAILGDGKRLRQVLTNMIGNAIKFTEHGTIVVRTSLVDKGDIACTIRFEIVDTGIGIPSHLHEHIFEGFSQADLSTRHQSQGTGLGLAISKHLVELMGGEVGLISRPGVGSNFWFTIKADHRRPATAADRDLTGMRTLVVASETVGGDTLRHQLTAAGATVVEVPNAADTLDAIRTAVGEQHSFDVALIDIRADDGLALAHEIRADEAARSLPVILVSIIERSRAELKNAGVDAALRKPVKEAELLGCVAKVTGRLAVSLPSDDGPTHGFEVWEALAGARVLVAEDNAVNREVATAMLQTLKCRVDVVPDGIQAVEAVQREHYDLVLLDCQMPNLDGYEATREIRRLEEQGQVKTEGPARHLGHLPIVALSAHTAPEDRARSLDSGVDDFVSKPYTFQTLRAVIGKWARGQEEPSALAPRSASVQTQDGAADDAPISEAALKQILEVDRLSGGGVFVRVARAFFEAAPPILERLGKAVRECDAEEMARAAHELRSASLNVGAESMARLSKELETLGRTGVADAAAASLAAQLDELYPAVKAALDARLEKDFHDDTVSV